MAMSREDCLLKLLALEPEPRCRIEAITGWPPQETRALLARLVADGRIAYRRGTRPGHKDMGYRTASKAE